MHAERGEEPEDAARLGRSRRVVVAGHHDDDRVGQCFAEPCELLEGVQNRRIGRTDVVEDVAGEEHQVRRERNRRLDRPPESVGDIRFALIDPARCQPLILPVAQVDIGEMNQPHRYRNLEWGGHQGACTVHAPPNGRPQSRPLIPACPRVGSHSARGTQFSTFYFLPATL